MHKPSVFLTVEQWSPGILAFITTRVTKASSWGNNRLIKLGVRNAFGLCNPVNLRLRSRSTTTRLARHHADKPRATSLITKPGRAGRQTDTFNDPDKAWASRSAIV